MGRRQRAGEKEPDTGLRTLQVLGPCRSIEQSSSKQERAGDTLVSSGPLPEPGVWSCSSIEISRSPSEGAETATNSAVGTVLMASPPVGRIKPTSSRRTSLGKHVSESISLISPLCPCTPTQVSQETLCPAGLSRPGPLPFAKARQKKAVSVWGLDRAKGHMLLPLKSSRQWVSGQGSPVKCSG